VTASGGQERVAVDELLALLGRGWQALLVYPGMLTAILLTTFMGSIWAWRETGVRPWPRRPAWRPGDVLQAGCVVLVLALLPLPRVSWPYSIDAVGALLLLEVPLWLRLRRVFEVSDRSECERAVGTAAALLNVYIILLLAVALLAQASGSLLLPALKEGQPALRWAGLAAWASAMPPLLSLGPWHVHALDSWLSNLRRVGHIALLLALALPPGDRWGHAATASGALVAFGSLTLLHFIWRGEPDRWERLQPALALTLLLVLLYSNAGAWLARLR